MTRGAGGDGERGREPTADGDLAAHVRAGVDHFNAGRFWQAHESLEVVWRQAPPPERPLWQALIQAAAAMLHRERGNRHGLLAQGGAALEKLRAPAPPGFPIETVRFLQELAACIEAGGPVPRMAFTETEQGA